MRLLFDHGVPAPLRAAFAGRLVETAYERGWSALENGQLLKSAEDAGFDLLVTTDKRMRFQQNMTGRQIAIVVLPTTNWLRLNTITEKIVQTVNAAAPGTISEVPAD